MKLIDQYIVAVGRRLPFKGRMDIQNELRSLLLDELESRYGKDVNEDQVSAYLTEFGSPASIAQRYMGNPSVISPGLVPLYRLLLLIVLGAQALAFFVTMIVGLISGSFAEMAGFYQVFPVILMELGQWILRTLFGWVWSVGAITLVMMAISRLKKNLDVDPDGDWTVEELKDIEVDSRSVSRFECVAGLVFLGALVLFLNLRPDFLQWVEARLLQIGAVLAHRIAVPRFRLYLGMFSVIWLTDMLRLSILLARGIKSRLSTGLELGSSAATLIVSVFMLMDSTLYSEYSGLLGWRLVFLLMCIVSAAELFWQLGTFIWNKVKARQGASFHTDTSKS